MATQGEIRLGTSAFTAAGWPGTFYPEGTKPADYLSYYATKFDTVEVDATFYRTPSLAMVRDWYAKTPKGFLFAYANNHYAGHGPGTVELFRKLMQAK